MLRSSSEVKAEADALALDMPFARVGHTADGEALMIGHRVFMVNGPGGNCAELFARALRRAGRDAGGGLIGASA